MLSSIAKSARQAQTCLKLAQKKLRTLLDDMVFHLCAQMPKIVCTKANNLWRKLTFRQTSLKQQTVGLQQATWAVVTQYKEARVPQNIKQEQQGHDHVRRGHESSGTYACNDARVHDLVKQKQHPPVTVQVQPQDCSVMLCTQPYLLLTMY